MEAGSEISKLYELPALEGSGVVDLVMEKS